MTKAELFEHCFRQATEIVRGYRAEAPAGFDPQATWVAVAGVAVSAGVGIYSANKQSSDAKKAQAGLNVGGKPKAAKYDPVNFDQEQLATILGNISSLGAVNDLTHQQNLDITHEDLARARRTIPGYRQMMKTQGMNTQALLNGTLPFDDVLQLAADRSSASSALGTPGTAGPATFRDLGLSRLDGMKTGAGMMKGMVDIADSISPVSRYGTGREMMLSPADRIRLAMTQNEKIQESEQSANNLAAGVSPTDQANQMLRLNGAMNGPDYSSVVLQSLGGLADAYRSYRTSSSAPSGTYEGSFGTNPVPGVKNQIYRPSTSIAV